MAENSIAIDIGSTKIVSAFCDANEHAIVLTDEQSNRSMIACIGFTNRQRLFGFAAQCQATVNTKNTIFGGDLKTFQGPNLEFCPIRWSQDYKKALVVLIDYHNKTEVIYPEQLWAMLLSKVKRNAEVYLQTPVKNCVVTIPSCFTPQQRKSIEDSCKIAGFKKVCSINDTTAAAITYAKLKNHGEQYVLIFDIGATTTEASIAQINEQSVVIKANAAEMNLGGDNFVRALLKYFIREFKTETNVNLAHDDEAIARLRVGCEKLKKALSTNDTAKITLETFYQERAYDLVMTRQIFELTCANIFREILDVGRKLFQFSSVQKSDITATILIGGGCRIPKIQQDLKSFMHGGEFLHVLNQDEAVATGAAYYATGSFRVEELPQLSNFYGSGPGLDVARMQQLLQKFDDDEAALVDYMTQVNELEKLCYSYKRAIVQQNVSQEDENEVKNKCNQTLTWLEHAQTTFFDRNDFKRKSRELKEVYAFACNKNQEEAIDKNHPQPKVEPVVEENNMNHVSKVEPSPQQSFDEGVALLTAERYGEACEIFSYFMHMSKQHELPHEINFYDMCYYRAQCFFYLNRCEKAIQDIAKIPKAGRAPAVNELYEQAIRKRFIEEAEKTLRKIRFFQKNSQDIQVALSMLTKVIDTRPKSLRTFEEKRLASNLFHNRSILSFQMRLYDQALGDASQNMKLIHNNADMKEERDAMYDELKPYMKTIKNDHYLYRQYGQHTCEDYANVRRCLKDSKKSKGNSLWYCC